MTSIYDILFVLFLMVVWLLGAMFILFVETKILIKIRDRVAPEVGFENRILRNTYVSIFTILALAWMCVYLQILVLVGVDLLG